MLVLTSALCLQPADLAVRWLAGLNGGYRAVRLSLGHNVDEQPNSVDDSTTAVEGDALTSLRY